MCPYFAPNFSLLKTQWLKTPDDSLLPISRSLNNLMYIDMYIIYWHAHYTLTCTLCINWSIKPVKKKPVSLLQEFSILKWTILILEDAFILRSLARPSRDKEYNPLIFLEVCHPLGSSANDIQTPTPGDPIYSRNATAMLTVTQIPGFFRLPSFLTGTSRLTRPEPVTI